MCHRFLGPVADLLDQVRVLDDGEKPSLIVVAAGGLQSSVEDGLELGIRNLPGLELPEAPPSGNGFQCVVHARLLKIDWPIKNLPHYNRLSRPGLRRPAVSSCWSAEADKANSALNGKDLKGRTMTVDDARPRTDKPRTGFGGGRGGGRGGFGGGKRF
jgi:hypothetical protein